MKIIKTKQYNYGTAHKDYIETTKISSRLNPIYKRSTFQRLKRLKEDLKIINQYHII